MGVGCLLICYVYGKFVFFFVFVEVFGYVFDVSQIDGEVFRWFYGWYCCYDWEKFGVVQCEGYLLVDFYCIVVVRCY